jgi:hypothetical protein
MQGRIIMIHLHKEVNGKLEVVDFGFPEYRESYEKQGYVIFHLTNTTGISKKVKNEFIIHHIHRAKFNIRGRINDLICKLIPERFLKY